MGSIKSIRCLGIVVLAFFSQNLFAQYTVNGNATQDSCNLYTLTHDAGGLSGSVWNNNKIDLTQSFNFNFDVFLGKNDSPGADGIAFALQPISTSVGSQGGGLGYQGITPAVGVTIDTYQNAGDNDPFYDHIAIQLNGDLNHNSLNNIAGPVTAINGNNNIEDNAWHSLRIQWDAPTTTLSAYLDGSLRVTVVRDFVATVFGGNPLVYWGFTGSTGGEHNLQRFRTALDPSFHFGVAQKRCINTPITFYDSTISFTPLAKFYWDFGDGSPVDSININPVHIYTTAGPFTVTQTVIGADGCQAVNTQNILIGSIPVADFSTNSPLCDLNSVPFFDHSNVTVGTINSWLWDFGNSTTSTAQNPTASFTTAGPQNITLSVQTLEGCVSATLIKTINVFATPVVDFTFTDSVCLGQPTSFLGTYTVTGGLPVNGWNWIMDNNGISYLNIINPSVIFPTPGNHTVMFLASTSSLNCFGIKVKAVFVRDKPHAAIRNSIVCPGTPAVLQDSSYAADGVAITGFWWDLGNGQFSTQQNPTTTYNNAGPVLVKHVVTDARGCISDTLIQTVNFQPKPIANFGYGTPVCNGLPVQFTDSSKVTGDVINKWSWVYNGTEFSTTKNPTHAFASGFQTVKLIATSSAGCISDTAAKTFFVNVSPSISISFKDACKNALVNFTAADNSGTVNQWKWLFGDGATAITQNTQHTYTANGIYGVKLYATAVNGCYSDTLTGNITIYGTNVFAGNDTIAAAGQPVQLNASGGLSYTWSPATLLNDPNIANPIIVLSATQTFTVKAFTPQGCQSFDDVTVKIYKGPDIYLPNAFTPNGDGNNDVFRGIPVGIKQFNYLKIFNRWGQQIFYTTDYNKGWDGIWQNLQQPAGTYIVLVSGVDFKGNLINKKESFILIR